MVLKKYILILFAIIFIGPGIMTLSAQNVNEGENFGDDKGLQEEEFLNYTYIGPVLSAGKTSVTYTDWFKTKTEKKTMSGTFYSGGIVITVFAGDLCGDFQLKYVYNNLDYTLSYIQSSLTGKYLYPFSSIFSAGAGLGINVETPPSSRTYNGSAGFMLPLTFCFNLTNDTKLFCDFYYGYGSFGIGEDTSSHTAGANLGLMFKVGRL